MNLPFCVIQVLLPEYYFQNIIEYTQTNRSFGEVLEMSNYLEKAVRRCRPGGPAVVGRSAKVFQACMQAAQSESCLCS